MRIYFLPFFFVLHALVTNAQVEIETDQLIDNFKNSSELVFNLSGIKTNEGFEQTTDEIGTVIINKNEKYCNLVYFSDRKSGDVFVFNKMGLNLYRDSEWRFYNMSDAQAVKQELWGKLGLDLFCDVNELFNKIENSDDMEIVYTPNTDVDGEICDGIFIYSKISHSESDRREVKGWHIRQNDSMPYYYLNNLNHSADSDIVVCKYDYIRKRL